jgi:serine/threonine-protein kinase
VHLYEYVEDAPHSAVVQELVNGVSLQAMLDRNGPVTPEAALVVLKGSLLGLGAAHQAGVVHRDYKPANIVVTGAGDTKLIDFGIAVRRDRAVPSAGTPNYMAPEQWHGGPATPATDVYAATGVFVSCLTGRPPYASPSMDALRHQHLNAAPPGGSVPVPVRPLVFAGMAKDPARRPADAPAFLAELERIAAAEYGADWEERGRTHLGKAALLLALLFPFSTQAWDGIWARALTILGRREVLLGAGVVAAVLLGTTAVRAASPGEHAASHAFASATISAAAPPISTSVPSSGAPPTTAAHTSAAPSTSASSSASSSAHTTAPAPHPTTTPPTSPGGTTTPPASTTTPPPPATTVGAFKVALLGKRGSRDATTQASIPIHGPGPVSITVSYSDGTSTTLSAPAGTMTYQLTDPHTFPSCTGTWTVTVSTAPPAANGQPSASRAAC